MRETNGWVAKEDDQAVWLLWDKPVQKIPHEKHQLESGLMILKSDIVSIYRFPSIHKSIYTDSKAQWVARRTLLSGARAPHRTKRFVPKKTRKKKIVQTLNNPRTERQQILATNSAPIDPKTAQSAICPPTLEKFVRNALQKRKSSLIPFTLQSPALLELARHLKLHASGSEATTYLYIRGVEEYYHLQNTDPDTLIRNCTTAEGLPDDKALKIESRRLDDYVGELKDKKYSPGHISNCVKAVKALFRQNGLSLQLPYKLHKYAVSRDRAPTPEEINRMTELATLRDKIIVLMLALGGFRVGTLTKLQYRHVKFDLERGVTPIHVHVEAEITKGKYNDYDTFIGKEAADLLKAYLEARRTGGLPNKIPPENILDDSPLIRDEHAKVVKPLSPSQVYNVVHRLLAQAGLLGSKVGKRYQVRPHSLRKFFRTQLAALGVQTDYIEYMMGHAISTYHDVEMNGVEFLRAEYAKAGLSIRPKTESNKMAIVRDFLKSMDLKPEEVLSKEAQAMPHRTVVTPTRTLSEQEQINVMLKALMQKVKQDIIAETREAFNKTV